MNDTLYIQYLDGSGWTTNRVIDNGMRLNGNEITRAMQEVKSYFPNKRIRAIDVNDRIVDLLS